MVSVLTTEVAGGAEHASVALLEALAARGHDVELLTSHSSLADGTDVPVRRVDLGRKLSTATVRTVAASAPLHLARLARALHAARPFDVLLVSYKKEQLLTALLPDRLTGTIVWTEWGELPTQVARGAPRFAYLGAARRAALIVAASERARQSLVAAGVPRERTEVLPSAFDVEEWRPDPARRSAQRADWGVDDSGFVVASVSRFDPKKRNDVLIDAMRLLPDGCVLVLVGEGVDEDSLRERAGQVPRRVIFMRTADAELPAVLSGCDVMAVAPAPLEGEPRAAVLGQLAGRPVVATSGAGLEGTLGPGTGLIADPANDPQAVARCLDAYRVDASRRERDGAAGRELAASRHDRDVVAARLEALLGNATKPR